MDNKFNTMFALAADKKKGGSLGAIFKLIQELLEFEDKIVECCDAQEMGENKERIEALKAETGEMYSTLFEMAQGGVDSHRNKLEIQEGDDEGFEDEVEESLEEDRAEDSLEEAILELPKPSEVNSVSAPSSLRLPEAPKM
jgi:hypothetical protein